MKSHHKAKFILLITSIIWGIAPVFLEVVLDYLNPLHIITMRFGIAVLVLSLFLPLFKKHNRLSLLSSKTCILIAWLNALGCLAATIGQKMTTAGLATLISTSFVFVVPFLAWKLKGTRPDQKIIITGFTTLIGIFLISYNGNWANFSGLTSLGILFLMLAALAWAFYLVLSGKILKISNIEDKKINLFSFMYAILLHTFLPLFILSLITTGFSFSLPLTILPFVLFLAIFPTIVAFGLYSWAIARIGSVRTSFYLSLQVVVPFIYELVFLKQYYSSWIYCGIFLILISLGLSESSTGLNMSYAAMRLKVLVLNFPRVIKRNLTIAEIRHEKTENVQKEKVKHLGKPLI
ncbi:MAG: DMT family transporter [Candidatus Hodarchaeota archaeon]